jgi:hypothetical protein
MLVPSFVESKPKPKPDLKALAPDIGDIPILDAGDTLSTDIQVRNAGKRKAKASATAIYLSQDQQIGGDDLLGTESFGAIGKKKTAAKPIDINLPVDVETGLYYLVACADANEQVKERKENNNCAMSTEQLQIFAPGVFVRTDGATEGASGTRTDPWGSVQAGVSAAVGMDPAGDVYVAAGDYGAVSLANGVTVHGGFDPTTWAPGGGVTRLTASGSVVTAESVTGAGLIDLEVVGQTGAENSIGVFARSSSLSLDGVSVQAAAGEDGSGGTSHVGQAPSGGDGGQGDPGVENSSGLCDEAPRPDGGTAGTSVVGRIGGTGGQPGVGNQPGSDGTNGTGPGGGLKGVGVLYHGNPALAVHVGDDGADGIDGPNGPAGSSNFSIDGYETSDGAAGAAGTHGSGGGGGGGGGGGDTDCDSYGGGGGGGGGGAAGGPGGGGGETGGASVGVYLWATTLDISNSSVTTAVGGNGGAGGTGQLGGVGGLGGPQNIYGGLGEQDDATNGAAGGAGGDGGDGGDGGGGAGGPSIGVVIGGASVLQPTAVTYTIGPGGAGGTSPGNAGPAGASSQTLTTP